MNSNGCEEGNTASDLAGRLRELGYAVPGPFVTVREALAELEEGVRPDLFLLDLDLQGDLSGKVLARLVRERFGRTREAVQHADGAGLGLSIVETIVAAIE